MLLSTTRRALGLRTISRAALCVVLLGGCDPALPSGLDAGDAGAEADAAALAGDSGIGPDSGAPLADSGSASDAGGMDSGAPLADSGSAADAGDSSDASVSPPADAGVSPPADAGPLSCSTPDTYYRDADGDGFGDPDTTVASCDPVAGFVLRAGDCDDGCDACNVEASEVCDGLDNDCDGTPDEGFECVAGAALSCTTSCGSAGDGLCSAACTLPTTAECVPPTEVCNGLDDDCDGTADNGFECARGTPVVCSTICGSTNTATCSASCELPTAAECVPPSEVCNGIDDDCDGTADNGFDCVAGASLSCTTSCGSAGDGVCSAACTLPTAAECVAPAEVCNGLDDDCNGHPDNGFDCVQGTTIVCSTTCGSLNTAVCSASCGVPTAAECPPPNEACNGLDDDCDGAPDNGFACVQGSTTSCTTSCGSTGTGTCTDTCGAPTTCAPPAEACDYSDTDCDGIIDELMWQAGPPNLTGTFFVRRPKVAAGLGVTRGVYRRGPLNVLFAMDESGEATSTIQVVGSDTYDFEANPGSPNAFFYAYVSGSGDIQLHRLENTPSAADPFAWTRTISADAVEVHLAIGTSNLWVYWRNSLGQIFFEQRSTANGLGSGSRVGVGTSSQPIAVASNAYTRHMVAYVGPLGVYQKSYNSTTRTDFHILTIPGYPASGQEILDLAIVADTTSTTVNGVMTVYALGSPNEIRYHFRRWSDGEQYYGLIAILPRVAPRTNDYSQMDLRMRGDRAFLAYVRDTNVPRLVELRRRPTPRFYERSIATGLPAQPYEGVSVVLQPSVAGSDPSQLNRLYYDPSGNPTHAGIGSIPIGCY